MNRFIEARPFVSDRAFSIAKPDETTSGSGTDIISSRLLWYQEPGFIMKSKGDNFHPLVRLEIGDLSDESGGTWTDEETIEIDFSGPALQVTGFLDTKDTEILDVPAGKYTVHIRRHAEPGTEDYRCFNEPDYSPRDLRFGKAMETWLIQLAQHSRISSE